jgi:hypothetical protein
MKRLKHKNVNFTHQEHIILFLSLFCSVFVTVAGSPMQEIPENAEESNSALLIRSLNYQLNKINYIYFCY